MDITLEANVHAVDRAAAVLGSQVALAALLGVTKAAVGQWKLEGRQVPLEHCLAIEKATQGVVTRADLRPDDYWLIWPDLDPPSGVVVVAPDLSPRRRATDTQSESRQGT